MKVQAFSTKSMKRNSVNKNFFALQLQGVLGTGINVVNYQKLFSTQHDLSGNARGTESVKYFDEMFLFASCASMWQHLLNNNGVCTASSFQ